MKVYVSCWDPGSYMRYYEEVEGNSLRECILKLFDVGFTYMTSNDIDNKELGCQRMLMWKELIDELVKSSKEDRRVYKVTDITNNEILYIDVAADIKLDLDEY